MDTCVIYNSVAARHRARERMRRFNEVGPGKWHFGRPNGMGTGLTWLVRPLWEGFATVAAAGGDGPATRLRPGS